jgi:hypothetical protein
MRQLFLVLAKLLGLFQLYWALTQFMQISFFITAFSSGVDNNQTGRIMLSFIGWMFYLVVTFGAAWLLLVRNEWLADKLRIQDDKKSEMLDHHSLLQVGVRLIGVYVIVIALPKFASGLVISHNLFGSQVGQNMSNNIIPSALQLAFGIFLAFFSKKVVQIISWDDEDYENDKRFF